MRLRAGLTQEELASKSHLTREYISLLELERRMPTIPVFIRICHAVGIAPAKMMAKLDAPPATGEGPALTGKA